jgi:hypothetical protein
MKLGQFHYDAFMNKKRFLLVTLSLFLVSAVHPALANASFDDYCGIGAETNSDGTCSPFWADWSSNDGFVKETQFIIQTADKEYFSGYSSHLYLALTCAKKKLSVEVFALDFPIFPDANLYGNGIAQVKFDVGKPRNIKYKRTSDLESLVLSDAKGFLKSFAKARTSVTFKIGNSDGYVIPTFLKLNFPVVAKQIKKAGCTF